MLASSCAVRVRLVAGEALLVLGEARRVRPQLRVVRAELAVEVPEALVLPRVVAGEALR